MEAQDYVSNIVQKEKMSRTKVTEWKYYNTISGFAPVRSPHGFVTFLPPEPVYTGSQNVVWSGLVALAEPGGK